MIQVSVRRDPGEVPVLRLTVSRDGEGGVASFVFPASTETAIPALVAAANVAMVKFLQEDLRTSDDWRKQ